MGKKGYSAFLFPYFCDNNSISHDGGSSDADDEDSDGEAGGRSLPRAGKKMRVKKLCCVGPSLRCAQCRETENYRDGYANMAF